MAGDMASTTSSLGRICAGCGKDATLRCSRCKKYYYCTRSCQRSHWSVHKRPCEGARILNLDTENPLKAAMVDFFANKSSGQEIAAGMLTDPDYQRRKAQLDDTLTPVIVRDLFLRLRLRRPDRAAAKNELSRAFALLFGSMDAVHRCIEKKEQEGDVLSLDSVNIADLRKSWPQSQSLRDFGEDANIVFVTVCTLLPLRALSAELQDITISHSLSGFTRASLS